MQIFPAIDLRGGQVVRLYQGDYDQETVYGTDPAAQARAFLDAGARYLHVTFYRLPVQAFPYDKWFLRYDGNNAVWFCFKK